MKRLLSLVLCFALLLTAAGCKTNDAVSKQISLRIGTLACEDLLPYWVAEQQELFEPANLKAEIIIYQSADDLMAAVKAAEVDLAVIDPLVAVSLRDADAPVELLWVALGQSAGQSHFGVMAHPDRGLYELANLADVPVAVAPGTITEYIYERMMADAGIPAEQVVTEDVRPLQQRYDMMVDNQLAAAVLPATHLYTGDLNGMVLIADNLDGEYISMSLVAGRVDFIDALPEDGVQRLRQVWDQAVGLINADPGSYRSLLADKLQLPAQAAEGYPIADYPLAARPDAGQIDAAVRWMSGKGYISIPLAYNPETGRIAIDLSPGGPTPQ